MTNAEQAVATTTEPRRPYAAASNVIEVLKRCRSRNLPDRIDNDFLALVGISEIVFGRVREALVFLGLIEEDGSPSSTLRAISAASDEEYVSLLEGAVRAAY